MKQLEICCGTLADVEAAVAGGADRIELCSALSCGGVTPSRAMIEAAVRLCSGSGCRVHVLIRCREGNFVYSEEETAQMAADIKTALSLGADGIVIGALTSDGDIDVPACKRLIDAAQGRAVTFSRAYDVAINREKSLKDIIALGCDRLLTSGGAETAIDGASEIKQIISYAGESLRVIAASGVTIKNLARLISLSGAEEIHGSFRTPVENLIQSRPLPGLDANLPHTTVATVRKAREILNGV